MSRIVELTELASAELALLAERTWRASREHSPLWMLAVDDASRTLAEALEADRIALAMRGDDGTPIAWIGGMPAWGRVWELHPLIVAVEAQRAGIGRALVAALEERVRARGALTLMLGTSDETGATTLANVDLYEDTAAKLGAARAHGAHPLAFWQRVGYRVVGVIPDAEAEGKPSILLARRLG